MNVTFTVDASYLIAHTLSSMEDSRFSSKENRKDIVDFQNVAWELSSDSYNFLVGRGASPGMIIEGKLEAIAQGIDSYLKALKATNEFKKIEQQTNDYLQWCQLEWQSNYEKSYGYIQKITRLTLNKDITVYLTHPSLRNGLQFADNKISWGHSEDWPNYTVVYLWHEILHTYFGSSDIEHAVIELIADNGLRAFLNDETPSHDTGHYNLSTLRTDLFPEWEAFLQISNNNVAEWTKQLLDM